jgi:hypothetical protein
MTGRPLGRRSFKTYLADQELNRLAINPIEEAIKCLAELDDVKEMNLKAFRELRGYGSDGKDAGTQYLANAIKCISEKTATYMQLARFRYPMLSAVAIKDMSDDSSSTKTLTTQEAIRIISQDPFSPVAKLTQENDRTISESLKVCDNGKSTEVSE